MGEMIQLKSADGTVVPAYVARPAGTPKGAVVVVQEICSFTCALQNTRRIDVKKTISSPKSLFQSLRQHLELTWY